jgi:hypothetical protein
MLRIADQSFALRTATILGNLALMFIAADATLSDCRADLPRASKAMREAAIAAALEEVIEFDFQEQPLTDVFDYLKQKHEIEIQLDTKALTDAGVGTDTPITRHIKGITLDSALDLILSELDLAWIIHDEVLYITSNAAAQNMVETRVYPVSDLLMPVADDLAYESLIEVLAEAATASGATPHPHSIRIYRPAAALVITRSVLVHRRVEKLLKELRQAKAEGAVQAVQ